MQHREYVAERERRDPEFREAREANRFNFAFQVALIRARLAAGLTQKQLAERLHTSQGSIARWENGDVIPNVVTLRKLSEVLDLSFTITAESGLTVQPAH